MTSIEIGGGTLVQPGWVNLDSRNGDGDWKRMAQDTPWPAADNSIDGIRALKTPLLGEPKTGLSGEVWPPRG